MVQNKSFPYGNEEMFRNIQDQASEGGMHVLLKVCQVAMGGALVHVFKSHTFAFRVTF